MIVAIINPRENFLGFVISQIGQRAGTHPLSDETDGGHDGGFANYAYLPGVAESPGEAKNDEWVYSELARRLGIGEQYNQYYNGENWSSLGRNISKMSTGISVRS